MIVGNGVPLDQVWVTLFLGSLGCRDFLEAQDPKAQWGLWGRKEKRVTVKMACPASQDKLGPQESRAHGDLLESLAPKAIEGCQGPWVRLERKASVDPLA